MSSSDMPGSLWSFGYGSNMDVIALEKKKHVKVLEHTPAILKDFSLTFGTPGMPWVEPAYACICPAKGSEVHGVAFLMTQESLEELNRTELGYNQAEVTLKAYDGRDLAGFVYAPKNGWPEKDLSPSARYLGVLIKGANQAGLDKEYIKRLESHPTYSPPEWLIQLRKSRPNPEDLAPITVEELAEHTSQENGLWVACLGYVVQLNKSQWALGAHRGRDVTTRTLMQFHGIPLDDNDDKGRPPYPLVADLNSDELEYVTRWLDFYQAGKSIDGTDNLGEIIGYIPDFLAQQKSGKTTFQLPPIPT